MIYMLKDLPGCDELLMRLNSSRTKWPSLTITVCHSICGMAGTREIWTNTTIITVA